MVAPSMPPPAPNDKTRRVSYLEARRILGGNVPPPAMPPTAEKATSKPKRPRAGLALETAMRDALVAAGYVEDDDFVREYAFALDEGRAYRFDFRFLGTDVAVEVEGQAHSIKRQRHDDCEKASLAAALGYRVVRVHRQMIENGSAVQFVRRAIELKKAAATAAKGE
jgi:hypothetical protein